jgi:Cft2 family RNA processing exonuclease
MSISAETGSTTTFTYSDVVNEANCRGNDLASTVFLAEAAMLCNASPDTIIKKLACKKRINMKAITRDVSSTQTRYNVVDFEEVEDDGSIRLRRVIAMRGSTSIRNLQDSTDSLFDYDELLQMNVHRGFRRVMYSILDDFPEFVLNKHVAVDNDSKEEGDLETREIKYSLCGHSLGYISLYIIYLSIYLYIYIYISFITRSIKKTIQKTKSIKISYH